MSPILARGRARAHETDYNRMAEYSGAITNTMPPARARLYSESRAVAFRSTDGMDCPTCGRALRPNVYARHVATHAPGHAEARRAAKAERMRVYHRTPAGQATYLRTQVDTCGCGKPKVTKAEQCRSCAVLEMPDRFWSKVDTSVGLFDCWPWLGASDEFGRGTFRLDGRTRNAPAVALELTLGRDLLPTMGALHTCDNPPCCNPAHLYEGTQQQNIADMVARGRHRSQAGI